MQAPQQITNRPKVIFKVVTSVTNRAFPYPLKFTAWYEQPSLIPIFSQEWQLC